MEVRGVEMFKSFLMGCSEPQDLWYNWARYIRLDSVCHIYV